ncbi:ricin-type beta-trefoil lectin domain protein [Pendulispora brunnea]|uniref:Ricin-type beta-trefoil lectin domain protein n=1 Tax=Pendulispora brunnea TaxID=2905690 RepID=A0ABZ2KN84_9BACT
MEDLPVLHRLHSFELSKKTKISVCVLAAVLAVSACSSSSRTSSERESQGVGTNALAQLGAIGSPAAITAADGRCLSISSTKAGSIVRLAACTLGARDQAWTFNKASQSISPAANAAKCVTVRVGQVADGMQLQLARCSQSAAQRFELPLSALQGKITAPSAGSKCFAADVSNTVILRGCDGSSLQNWKLDSAHAAVPTVDPSGIASIASGGPFMLATTNDGRIFGWGSNAHAVVQAAKTTSSLARDLGYATPSRRAISVAAGQEHACAALGISGDNVACWGNDSYGQIADHRTQDVSSPKTIPGIQAVDLVAGRWFTCARASTGGVKCWGTMRFAGEKTLDMRVPRILLESGAVEFAAGSNHLCVRTSDGKVSCLGNNTSGQAGVTTATWMETFFPINLPRSAVAIFAGGDASCAKLEDDSVYCWGTNGYGVFGSGLPELLPGDNPETPILRLGLFEPTHVPVLDAFERLELGAKHSCGDKGDGSLWCWGTNDSGELGVRTSEPSRVAVGPISLGNVPLLSYAVSRDAAAEHTCALRNDGQVWCWGDNTRDMLDNRRVTESYSPVPVQSYPAVTQ